MKRIILMICCAVICMQSFTCYALTSDSPAVNLITNQGKTGLVKEYGSINAALENAKSGDTIELIENNSAGFTVNADKNLTVTTGEKRSAQIIIGGAVKNLNTNPKAIGNVCINGNGNEYLIKFRNIYVNGTYISATGDTNSDSGVNILDLVKLKKSFTEIKDYEIAKDINLDSQNNAFDLTVLVNLLVGKYDRK